MVLKNQRFLEAAVSLLGEDVEMLPVSSMDGSGRVAGVMSPFDVVLKAFEPCQKRGMTAEDLHDFGAKRGPKPDILKVEGDCRDLMKQSLQKKNQKDGWPS